MLDYKTLYNSDPFGLSIKKKKLLVSYKSKNTFSISLQVFKEL